MPFKKIKKFENLNINQLVDKLNNNGPFLLSIFILSVIAWQISQLFWAIYPNKRVINYIDTTSIISKNETRFNSTSNQPNKVIQDITNQDLFGVDKEINMTSENRNILFKPDFDADQELVVKL